MLLSGLVVTADAALTTFRERRAADKELDTAHLQHARDILDYISEAIIGLRKSFQVPFPRATDDRATFRFLRLMAGRVIDLQG